MTKQPKSRLDRELEEILEKKSREPIPFSSHPRAPKHGKQAALGEGLDGLRNVWDFLTSAPILLAFTFAIAARLVSDVSPLLALLFAAGTVASLWLPGLMQRGQPTQTGKPDVKYWRGRPYVTGVKDAVSRHPVDSLKRYFDRRR